MVEKIFNALKQEYSHLGLGDIVLKAYAESLAAGGFVTDENLKSVIEAQKQSLETIQKANDRRATEAAEKAKAEAEKRAAEEAEKKKKEEEEKKLHEEKKDEKNELKPKEDEIPDWFKAYQTAQEEKYKEAVAKNEELAKSLADLQTENNKFKEEQSAAKRNSFIASEAKRLGVPSWRTEEGFSITPEMDEKAITEYITKVANNVNANMLPEDKSGFPKFDGNVSKEQVDAIADSLLK